MNEQQKAHLDAVDAELDATAANDASISDSPQVYLGQKVFSFTSKAEWIKSASKKWKALGVSPCQTICIDQKGRICAWGAHFAAAQADEAYPVDVYMLRQDIKVPEVTA